VLMIKVAAAFLLLLGSGLIFKALVAMDAPTLGPRIMRRRAADASPNTEAESASALRRAA
jgi:hypothetical protein